MHRSHFPEFEQEHQFTQAVKQLTAEVVEAIDQENMDAVFTLLDTHPVAGFLKMDGIVSEIVARHNAVFEPFMAHVRQRMDDKQLNSCVRAMQTQACTYDFVQGLDYDTRWQSQHFLSNHLLNTSVRHGSIACLKTIAVHMPIVSKDVWSKAASVAVAQMCPETLNILMERRPPHLQPGDYAFLLALKKDDMRPLQDIVFDHMSLSDVLDRMPHYRHDDLKRLHEQHQHLRNTQQRQRIEHNLPSHSLSRERKL